MYGPTGAEYTPAVLRNGAQRYVEQDAWAVDSVNGDDRGPGTLADPLLTLPELSRRWMARTWDPAIQLVDVTLLGTFPSQRLALAPNFPGGGFVNYRGQMTLQQAAQAITGYTAEAPPVRARLDVAAFDFAPFVGSRLRMTTGVQTGALAWIQGAPALGQANITQFELPTVTGSFSTVNPAVGDQFVIETPATFIDSTQLTPFGYATHTLRDIAIGPTAPGVTSSNSIIFGTGISTRGVRIFGSRLTGAAATVCLLRGYGTTVACLADAPFTNIIGPSITLQGFGWRGSTTVSSGNFLMNRGQGEGSGVRAAGFGVSNSAALEYNSPWSVFDSLTTFSGAVVLAEDGSQFIGSVAAAVYGTNPLAAAAARIRNGCGWSAITLPTMASGGAPLELILANAAAIPWANAIAAAPNNAYMNVRQ